MEVEKSVTLQPYLENSVTYRKMSTKNLFCAWDLEGEDTQVQ